MEGQALVQRDEWGAGVLVRGIDIERERSTSRFFDYITQGTLSGGEKSVVVGSELAKRFYLGIGSEIKVLSQNSEKPVVFKVEGFFTSGLYEYDANLIFMNLKSAQAIFQLKGTVSGIAVSLKDPERAPEAKRAIQKKLGPPYFVRTWMDMNKTLFGALKLEKAVMSLILALIILVACLNIAGSLTIMVMDKTKDIGVLKALGAAPFSLMKIFALDGLLIGLVGAGSGFFIGTGICFLLKNYKFVDLPREIYYFDRLPVKMEPWDVAAILGVAVGLSFLSAFYPARMAGRLDPVKALRYE